MMAHFELYRAITLAGNPSGLAVSKAALLSDMNKQLTKATTQAVKDPSASVFPGMFMTPRHTEAA